MSMMDEFYNQIAREYVYPDAMQDAVRIDIAVDTLLRYSPTDGAHHKAWVFDQVLRQLLGSTNYARKIQSLRDDDYEWEEGTAP